MKKIISVLLSSVLILSALSFCGFAVSAISDSGTWGDLSWSLDEDGILVVSGNGYLEDFPDDVINAWHYYYTWITEVRIENGVTGIGVRAFHFTSVAKVSIPASVSFISGDAFGACSKLEEIKVDDANAYYCDVDGVLFNKEKTELVKYPDSKGGSAYVIPNGVEIIAFEAFSSCSSLESITIPDGVTTIEDNAFNGCYGITDLVLPATVKTVGKYAFAYCDNIKSVTLYSGCESVASHAFYGCSGITEVYYNGTFSQWLNMGLVEGNQPLTNATMTFVNEVAGEETGDVNGDGEITNTDAAMVLKYDAGIYGFNESQLSVADANGNGVVENLDATLILKYDAGIINVF